MSKPLKIALVQTEVLPGRPRENADKIIRLMSEAKSNNARLVIFSEMAVFYILPGEGKNSISFLLLFFALLCSYIDFVRNFCCWL